MGIDQFLLDRERKEGREEGREEGIEKGIERKRIEIVISLHEDGLQIDRIAKITKLSIDEVNSVLKNNS